ncbi:MAG: DUF5684 domain-containing protein [Candidatus Omnitrophica bacterium]|nr:DUF5684 domain-containing protein [Candidatus Omnitrophota bacterium]MDD5737729.1 DUF5684 domain-containing protein [Candidatus Omnitrophota bacterium]
MKKTVLLCAVMLLLSANLRADTLSFKSGKTVEGNIKSIADGSVTVEIFGVTEMTYDLADIQEINGQAVDLKPAVEAPAVTEELPAVETSEEITLPSSEQEIPQVKLSNEEKVLAGGVIAILVLYLGIILAVALGVYVFSCLCLQLIARKTGTEPAWLAWIPVANMFLACKIGGLSYLWLLALLVPFVNMLVSIYIWYRISEARGKPGLLSLLLLVPVANFVFMGYLAFSGDGSGTAAPSVKGGEPASPVQDRPYRPPLE